MNILLRSEVFSTWLENLKDPKAKARILSRLDAAAEGNFGDCEAIGEGVSEMRIHVGPGYRIYFTRRGTRLYLLLMGGSKASQRRDIKVALQMAREFKE